MQPASDTQPIGPVLCGDIDDWRGEKRTRHGNHNGVVQV
jgi:hypothetical protein